MRATAEGYCRPNNSRADVVTGFSEARQAPSEPDQVAIFFGYFGIIRPTGVDGMLRLEAPPSHRTSPGTADLEEIYETERDFRVRALATAGN